MADRPSPHISLEKRMLNTSAAISFKFFFFLIVLMITEIDTNACTRRIIVSNTKTWTDQFTSVNTTYILNNEYDLNGTVLTIPKNSCLVFEGGRIINGTVQGNNTIVEAGRVCLFKNVTISGKWRNKTVYSEWLDFVEGERIDNSRNFMNLMVLCNGDSMTHLFMQSGVFFCSVAKESSFIQVPSNVYWHNSATIQQLPTSLQKYSLVLIKQASYVTIDGGEFIGDVRAHLGNEGEWGHGIKVAGSTNVTLKNLVSKEFWGDGIDLIEANYVSSISAGVGICNNIKLDNVKCLYNRRQGISIEAARNVSISNSEFAYTGKYKMTEPGCGVDIEPWCNNEHKIENIRFENCDIHHNNPQRDFCVEANLQYYLRSDNHAVEPANRIVVNNCRVGKLYILRASQVSFNNCEIDDVTRVLGKRVTMTGCVLKERSGIESSKGLTIKR